MLTRRSDSGTWVAANGTSPIELGAALADGERRLMIAVLVHALRSLFRDAEKPGRGAARRLRQDLRWLTSEDRTEVFAFERICESLGFESQRIRERILDDLGVRTSELLAEPVRPRRRQRAVEPPPFEAHALAV